MLEGEKLPKKTTLVLEVWDDSRSLNEIIGLIDDKFNAEDVGFWNIRGTKQQEVPYIPTGD